MIELEKQSIKVYATMGNTAIKRVRLKKKDLWTVKGSLIMRALGVLASLYSIDAESKDCTSAKRGFLNVWKYPSII